MLIAYIRIFGFIISDRIGRKISANQNLVKSREMVRWRQVFLAWQLYASDNDPVLAEKKERKKKKEMKNGEKKVLMFSWMFWRALCPMKIYSSR